MLVWTIFVVLLLSACNGMFSSEPTSDEISQNGNCGLGIKIVGFDDGEATPGDVLELEANMASIRLDYDWAAEPESYTSNFTNPGEHTTSFPVPDKAGVIQIHLTVTNSLGCQEEDFVEVTVVDPEEEEGDAVELVAMASPASAATSTPTDLPRATAEPTQEATLEPTEEPTKAPTVTSEPTESPTPTKTATSAPLPTAIAEVNAPIITYLEFLPGGAVKLAWTWDGVLSPTQNFAVRFWSQDDPRPEARFSITWTKGFAYEFGVTSADFPIGTYLINVAVMEGPSEGYHYELARSEDLALFINPLPPPPTPEVP